MTTKKTAKGSEEVKGAPLGAKGVGDNYQTSYNSLTGIVDGLGIARNNRTFGIMYRKNIDIRACIRELQETALKNGYELRKSYSSKDGDKVVYDENFTKALGRIKELSGGIIKNLSLFANVFIQKRRDLAKRTMGYKVLDSRYVTIITDSNLVPLRYMYAQPVLNGGIIEFPAKDILHWKRGEDFDNIVYGDSFMEALVLDVLGEEEANLSNYFYFQNDAVPSAIYVIREGLSAATQEKIMNTIRETLNGGHNKHKAIVADGVTDIKQMKSDHNDADFLELRKFTTLKVCAAFGVPRTVIGYVEEVNMSNGDAQYKKFIENTIEPLERELEAIFSELSKDFLGYQFCINSEHIDQMEQRSKLAQTNVEKGLWTRNEARLYIGYEPSDNELADELTVPTTVQLLDTLASTEPLIPQEQTPIIA